MRNNFNQGRLTMRLKALLFFITIAILHLSNLNVTAQRTQSAFHKGDALRLTIWQLTQLGNGSYNIDISGDYPIDNLGNTFFPLLGDVRVTGHNRTTLAAELRDQLSAYIQDPTIIVEPLIRVTMLGAFRRPGTYLVPPNASLWQLVDLAGGPDDDSNLVKMSVERGGKVVKKKLLGGFERGFTLRELGIRSGDQVLVPNKTSFGVRDAAEILRFGVSIVSLYFLIQKF